MSILFSPHAKSLTHYSTAFYYANNPPLELLATYERVILEPENISAEQLSYLQQRGVTVYAYLSIGEVAPSRSWFNEIKEEWKRGTNTGWKSAVLDMTSKEWHDYLLNKKMQELWKQGYRGFFLDTMDSYQLFAKTESEQREQQQGMVRLLKAMKKQYKDVHLLFNRGFEILEQSADLADGLIAESLFAGWDAGTSQYKAVSENDRQWLLEKLKQTQTKYNLPVTVLDYLPPEQREEAEKVADKITRAGFTPWVSTPELNYMGVGSRKLIPRKVLFLYDSREEKLATHDIHRLLAMPLEYLGYIPDYKDLAQGLLPEFALKGRYAGIVTWLYSDNPSRDAPLADWMLKQVQQKIPVAFFGDYTLAQNQQLNSFLKLDFQQQSMVAPATLKVMSNNVGFEIQPVLHNVELASIKSSDAQPWIKIVDSENKVVMPVFISSWGGIAFNPYLTGIIPALGKDEEYKRWIINPFEFLKAALKLKNIPVPDATTENGNRILTLHIDGDGFANKTQVRKKSYSPELIRDEFIKPLSLPHTVSIIEGEIGKTGLYPKLSEELENIARDIFKLPNVEIASHSYSHPFDWSHSATEKQPATPISKEVFKVEEGAYHLPIPGYTYNVEREIKGSVDYIDGLLAPANKKTKVFLWTGDCLPNEDAIALTYKMQLTNLNGGDTIMRKGMASLTLVAPSGIAKGAYFQAYAPLQNENVYTKDWTGPYYGYQQVIETFQLTDKPRRLKPISIYYHFYSGDKLASVQALHRVYDWVLQQETLPMWISEYTPRVNAFRNAAYEELDNGWRIYGAEDISTLRLQNQTKQPDIAASTGVAGYRKMAQGLYIALNKDSVISLKLTQHSNSFPYLEKANARIQYWHKTNNIINFRLAGHMPVNFSLKNCNTNCILKNKSGQLIKGTKQTDGSTLFKFINNDTGALQVFRG